MPNKLLILIVTFILFTGSLLSQEPEPPCSYPCPPPFKPWTRAVVLNHTLPGGSCPTCLVSFEYWYRECGEEIQVVLGSVHITGNCTQCEGWINWYAADWAVRNNPLIADKIAKGWTDTSRFCYEDYKLSLLACYQWVPGGGGIVINPGGWHTEPCNSTACCKFTLEICKNEDGILETAYQLDSPFIICDEGCFSGCNFYGDYLEKMNNYNNTLEYDNNNTSTAITPNPNDGSFTVNLKNYKLGNYSIVINDLLGNIIFNHSISVNSVDYQYKILLDNSKPGTYIYRIMFDNEVYQTGKLNITK